MQAFAATQRLGPRRQVSGFEFADTQTTIPDETGALTYLRIFKNRRHSAIE